MTVTVPAQIPYKEPQTISGTAVDNQKVASIDYSTDGGKTWTTIKTVTGLSTTSARITFSPAIASDGATSIIVRAKDGMGNSGKCASFSITIDRTGPVIVLTTPLDASVVTSLKLSGTATDPTGESTVLYSMDGTNWQPVDRITIRDTTTIFEFTPPPLDDGNYPISLKATDPLGNVSTITTTPLIIDRLPPWIGASIVSVGSQLLLPGTDGMIQIIPSVMHKLSTSIIGGPIEAVLTIQNKKQGKIKQCPCTKTPIPVCGSHSLHWKIPARIHSRSLPGMEPVILPINL